MPIFDYECPECKTQRKNHMVKRFDIDVECPKGCSIPMKKLINFAPTVHGLTTGHYVSDQGDVDEILNNTVDNLT